jgi:hypothetical protein
MKTIQLNLELDINQDREYNYIKDVYKKTKQDINAHISNIFAFGKHAERNYSIRHDTECTNKENEYINSLAEIETIQYENMYNELLKIKKENVILRQALKQTDIKLELTHIKYYGDTEQFII